MAQAGPSAATDPGDLGVLEAAGELRAGRLSASELLAAVLARIEVLNGGAPSFDGAADAVNAWARLYPERADAMARAADERIAREGGRAPLLCGIPIGLKDLYSVKGLPVTASSRVLAGNVAAEDSVAWARGVDAAAAACRRLGAQVIDTERPALASVDDFYLLAGVEVWSFHEQFAHRAELYRPFLREIVGGISEAGPAAEYVRAQSRRARLTSTWERWMAEENIDLLLEATVPTPAPLRTLGYEPVLPMPDPLILLTFAWDMTGFPVVALPAGLGRRSGLPVGVSLIAARGRETPLVQAGIDLQEHELEPPGRVGLR